MESEELFCQEHLDNIFNGIKKNIKKDIHYYDIHHQLEENEEKTIQKLLMQHTITPPQLHENDHYMIAPEESKSNLSTLWRKYKNNATATFTFVIPFSGEFELFYMKTDDQKLNARCNGIVTKNRLLLIYNARDFKTSGEMKEQYKSDVEQIKENLDCIKKAADRFNNVLSKMIEKEIKASKKVPKADKQLKVA